MKIIAFLVLFFSSHVFAQLKVITTTSNLESLTQIIGGSAVNVESLCKGVQDPHFLEAKPSYTFKLSKADLLISIGAGLEEAWLPLVIRGSHNLSVRPTQKGSLIVSEGLEMLETGAKSLSRSEGDVHPEGNPHFMLSPSYSLQVAAKIRDRLVMLMPESESKFKENYKNFKESIDKGREKWKKIIGKSQRVVSYHKTLTYFYKEFSIENIDVLEPKPGISPSASHIIKLIEKMKVQKVSKIIIENYFDDSIAKKIKRSIPNIKIIKVPVAVNGDKLSPNLIELYEQLAKKVGG